MNFSRPFRLFPGAVFLLFCMSMLSGMANAAAEFLEPEQAFKFSSKQVAADKVEVSYVIADGYYMYREHFKFDATGATLGQPVYPKGHTKFDETFQKEVETYRGTVTIQIPVTTQGSFTLIAHGQGCSDQGLCYAPMESRQTFGAGTMTAGTAAADSAATDSKTAGSDTDKLRSSLKSGRLLVILPLFMLLGLGLAFTPCVLPMVPILSSIIVGEGATVSRRRGLLLSLSYSLGMAIVYTALGVAAGLLGEGLAASLQNPWVLGTFALLMVGLSLSMFDVYHLQVPASVQRKLMTVSDGQSAGKLLGVFMMGAISGLIIGPCVAAPLASVLLYISQTRDAVLGGMALFAMAIGMSVPLLLVGLSAGSLLPKAGRWMIAIKELFGVMMLAMALWLVMPVLPVWLAMLGWAVLLISYGLVLLRQQAIVMKVVAVMICVLGSLQFVGLATGGRDVLAPLGHLTGNSTAHVQFVRVNNSDELNQALAQAKSQGKPVMLDFYADWCVSCKEMEKLTFVDPAVKAKFADMVLLQADVTANNEADKALLKQFNLFGPPGMIFFNLNSQESGRVVGFQKTAEFLGSLAEFVK